MKPMTLAMACLVMCAVAIGCGNTGVTKTPPPNEKARPQAPTPVGQPAAPSATPAPAVTPTPAATPAVMDDKTLFETSCSKCHGTSKVENFTESVPWKDIVDRMINARGAKITAEDGAKITAYLEKTYPRK